MRKIISRQEEEKKRKRNQIIVGSVLIFIMLFSMLGYAFQSQLFDANATEDATITYNGIVFTSQNGFWATNYEGKEVVFTYAPSQISEDDLSSLTKSINDLKEKPLYIFSEDSDAESELRFNLASFAEKIERACPEGTVCEAGLQTKDCNDNFIIIQKGTESVRQEQNCIFLSGEGDNLIKLADNILFKLFGMR